MAATPTPHRRLGFSVASTPSPSPFYTPRSERRVVDLRWADGNATSHKRDRDREVPVQVVLRCRPLNDDELRMNAQSVISCNEQKKEVTISQSILKQPDKTFTFDKVFGPKAQQRSIYDHAVSPLVIEALEGYNCTVFAFGQTGTGKTYSMEGEMKSKVNELSTNAGVIPRAVRHIFEILEERKVDYSMKITFLELYNEEITDLLATEEQCRFYDERQKRPICLLEDGRGGEVIRGLEEVTVYSPDEVYSLLERGSSRRRSVETAINKQSSRSHVVFSINIHMKEEKWGDEELLKYGRLSLVDLAGSENIARSGAKEGKAREAGEINKSLLTLGRVITALSEHSSHIPYRNSKLTRLLRESLGGKAKTCIVATISPSSFCLEDTLVTLDYASRARTIRNKPEANQKVSKAVLLKDLHLEIEKMKQDVRAAREKNGVYISHERFVQEEAEKKAMREKIEQLELLLDQKKKESERFKQLYRAEQDTNLDKEAEIKEYKINIETIKKALEDLEEVISRKNMALKEKDFIITSLLSAEHNILDHAKDLRNTLETTSGDMSALSSKIERQTIKEGKNKVLVQNLSHQIDHSLRALQSTVVGSVCEQQNFLKSTEEQILSYFENKYTATVLLQKKIERTKGTYDIGAQHIKGLINSLKIKCRLDNEEMDSIMSTQAVAVENLLATLATEAEQILSDMGASLNEHQEMFAFFTKKHEEGLQRSLLSTRAISEATLEFLNEIKVRSARVIKNIEESQTVTSNQLEEFEKTFKEFSAREERTALDTIAEILENLTATKVKMVSEVVGHLNEKLSRDGSKLKSEMSDVNQLSHCAESKWLKYTEEVEFQFEDDKARGYEVRCKSDTILQRCLGSIDKSSFHWLSAQSSINQLHKDSYAELEHSIKRWNDDKEAILDEVSSVSSQNDLKFQSIVSDMSTSSENSRFLDQEVKQELESISTLSKRCLKSLQGNHKQSLETIRTLANKCLNDDYLLGSPVRIAAQNVQINVPSLASIEMLRSSLTDIVAEFRAVNQLGSREKGQKQVLDVEKYAARSPLVALNINDDN
ncbi:Kinesin-like protein [Rhynchospora pubera]|uniref:Kinesin-like protein n=1 Tax=Rhynchospora pubera TaxID=906938 RepID=A0AAV8D5I5_9POAL|nr:Kinesin-like protein [Rhynchospora pubera]